MVAELTTEPVYQHLAELCPAVYTRSRSPRDAGFNMCPGDRAAMDRPHRAIDRTAPRHLSSADSAAQQLSSADRAGCVSARLARLVDGGFIDATTDILRRLRNGEHPCSGGKINLSFVGRLEVVGNFGDQGLHRRVLHCHVTVINFAHLVGI